MGRRLLWVTMRKKNSPQEAIVKRLTFKVLVPTILLGLFGAASSYAQIENRIDVNVPFSFYAGNALLPAGSYTVRSVTDAPVTLLVRSADEKVAVIVETVNAETVNAPKETNLVFDELEGKYFLSMIWLDGSPIGYQVVPSSMQHRLINKEPKHSHRYVKGFHIRKEK